MLADGQRVDADLHTLAGATLRQDPYHQLVHDFFTSLHAGSGLRILEIGSRARSGVTRRHLLPADAQYVGVDIVAGEMSICGGCA